jgi:hypothetical protein
MVSSYDSGLLTEPSTGKYDPASDSIIVKCAAGTFVGFKQLKTEGKAQLGPKDWWNGVRGSEWWGKGDGEVVRFLKGAV